MNNLSKTKPINMKSKWFFILTFFLIINNVSNTFGQENEEKKCQIGLGVSLFNFPEYLNEIGSSRICNNIYVPIDINKKVRIEPSFGFAINNSDRKCIIGLSSFLIKPISNFNFLYGIRLGYTEDNSGIIAPTIGGEYFFIKKFSIGAETQIRGIIHKTEYNVYSNTSVLIRFFF